MSVPSIFLSYAAEDATWKRNFSYKEWFGDLLGPVQFIDYKMGENLPFGSLDEWLKEKVQGAAVFVAFISRDYIEKEYPSKEWWVGLSEAVRQNFIFVPVMLDGAAKSWWRKLKQEGSLRDIGDDYAYSDFTDGNGRPALIVTDLGLPVDGVTRRIGELARLIKEHLEELVSKDDGQATPGRPPEPQNRLPEAQPRSGMDETEPTEPPTPVGSCQVVVLGHPSAVSSSAIATQTTALAAALKANEVPFIQWDDQWRTNVDARHGNDAPLAKEATLFIQPAGPGDAGDLAETRPRLRQWLERCKEAESPAVAAGSAERQRVLWLPEGLRDDSFGAAMQARAEDEDIILRNDSVPSLTNWIRGKYRRTTVEKRVAVLTLEEVDVNDSGKLREALHCSFHDIVGDVVHPKPELWTFEGELLVDQLRQMDEDCAIIAVHDLNTGVARGQREARMQLENKLGPITSEVERIKRAAGRKDLKLFWTALLVQKADQLPWVKYPSPSQFENWCLLPFVTAPLSGENTHIVLPKQGPLKVFRTYLRDWINEIHA